jgi:hypothetical protein
MTDRAPALPRAFFLAAAALLASGDAALAQDGDLPTTVADALVALIGSDPTLEASYESATGDAYFVSVTNLRIAGSAPDWSVLLPEVTIENPIRRDEGGFTADRLNFGDAVIEVEGEEVGGWAIAYYAPAIVVTPEEALNITSIPWEDFPAESAIRIEDLSVLGATVSLVEFSGSWTEGVYTVSGFNLPLEALGDDPSIAALGVLGITAIAADLTASMSIDFEGERLSFDEVTLSVASIADLDLSLSISGPDLFSAMFPTNPAAPASGKTPKGGGGGMTLVPDAPMPDLFLDSFSLTFTDRGLLSLPGIAPALEENLTELVGTLGGAARKQATAVLNGFFDGSNPAITISATPPEPVRFSELEAASADPAEVAALLGFRISSGN